MSGYVLGLDGGGTGCRAIMADADGRIVGRGQGGPCNINSDRQGALASLLDCAGQAMGEVSPSQVTAVLGLAGANISGARHWLAPLLPFGRSRVVHDAITSVAGALGPHDGIVAAMGTGSVFMRQMGGEVVSIGGWGPIIGDEGSGNWLGRRYLAHVLRACDGLAQETPLTRATLDRHGGTAGIVTFARDATGADFGAEARYLQEAPDDPATREILAAGADIVAQSIAVLQQADPLPVTFTGGLGPLYASLLADRWPQRPAIGTPLDGALRLAQEMGE